MTPRRPLARPLSKGWHALEPWQRRELLAGLWLVPAFLAIFAATWMITP